MKILRKEFIFNTENILSMYYVYDQFMCCLCLLLDTWKFSRFCESHISSLDVDRYKFIKTNSNVVFNYDSVPISEHVLETEKYWFI